MLLDISVPSPSPKAMLIALEDLYAQYIYYIASSTAVRGGVAFYNLLDLVLENSLKKLSINYYYYF